MINANEYRDINASKFNDGLHLNLEKLRIIKDANQVETGSGTDEINSVLGVLFVPDFYKQHTPSEQAKSLPADEVQAPVKETVPLDFEKNTPLNEVDQGSIVKQVLNKAIDNPDFWLELLENSSSALSQYKLTREAKAAIASGDVQWVNENVGGLTEKEKAYLYHRLEREAW